MGEMRLHSFKRKTSLHAVQSCALNYLVSLVSQGSHHKDLMKDWGEVGRGRGRVPHRCLLSFLKIHYRVAISKGRRKETWLGRVKSRAFQG